MKGKKKRAENNVRINAKTKRKQKKISTKESDRLDSSGERNSEERQI